MQRSLFVRGKVVGSACRTSKAPLSEKWGGCFVQPPHLILGILIT